MTHPIEDISPNLLLRALSETNWRRIAPLLTRVATSLHQPLEMAGEAITHVYFLEHGLASIVASTLTGHRNEVGLLGRDGMTGGSIILGDTESPFDSMVQMDGSALRLSAVDLQILIEESASIKKSLMGFARALTIQTAFTALANGQSHVDQRLARWLLMVHDRIPGDEFAITHEYLSVMLGVRRTGVTDAMHVLEGKGLISSTRNKVIIRDRAGLIEFSNGSYGPSEREYARLTGINLAKIGWMPAHQLRVAEEMLQSDAKIGNRIVTGITNEVPVPQALINDVTPPPGTEGSVSPLARHLQGLRKTRKSVSEK